MVALGTQLLSLLMAAMIINSVSAGLVQLTKAQKQQLLDKHNKLRADVANGKCPGQGSAANMVPLKWDDRLEETAGTWVGQCKVGHDSKEERAVESYGYVGQNWAGGSNLNLDQFVQMWYDEYKDFHLTQNACNTGKVCGHYTQVVWAHTKHIGCALASCSGKPGAYGYHLVCNYGPGGNYNGQKPYEAGNPAGHCEGKFTFKANGMCALVDQRSGTSSTCTLSSASCQNGGTFDSAKCLCNCAAGYFGNKCEKHCADLMNAASCQLNIDSFPGFCKGAYGPMYCCKYCDLCHTEGDDPKAKNAMGLVSKAGV